VQASQIIAELHALNGQAKVDFIKSDVSLLRNVDVACDEIKSREEKINLLFLSAGILTTKGRTGMFPVLHLLDLLTCDQQRQVRVLTGK
jgi:NAD(P)-dependent dehydrogenase (short-subunit alcohol dehydrogenase family)